MGIGRKAGRDFTGEKVVIGEVGDGNGFGPVPLAGTSGSELVGLDAGKATGANRAAWAFVLGFLVFALFAQVSITTVVSFELRARDSFLFFFHGKATRDSEREREREREFFFW